VAKFILHPLPQQEMPNNVTTVDTHESEEFGPIDDRLHAGPEMA
jgi:hypothetical protein